MPSSSRIAAGFGLLHLQAEQEGRRHRQVGMAGIAGRGFVDVDRIGLAGRLGEEAQPACLDRHREGRQRVADVAAVDHRSLSLLVHRHDARAAEAEVVLQREPRALDLALLGLAAQLPHQLGALRQAGRAQRVALRQQPAGRVGDDAPAVGVVAVEDELLGRAFGREAERLVGDQLVGGEAVVQLDDVDVLGADAGLLVDLASRRPRPCRSRRACACRRCRRCSACRWSSPARRCARCVSRPWLRANSSRADDRRGRAAGRRAALQPRQRIEHRAARRAPRRA